MQTRTTKSAQSRPANLVNGIDVAALRATAAEVAADPAKGLTSWRVATSWKGGTRSDTRVTSYEIGGQEVEKDFTISVDEPVELCGTNRFANPQEVLLAALNACMIVGYVASCALEEIEIEELTIETEGDIDLRGFLGLDPAVKPGYDELRYRVSLKCDATPEQVEKVHDNVCRTSPNRFNLSQPIKLETRLVSG